MAEDWLFLVKRNGIGLADHSPASFPRASDRRPRRRLQVDSRGLRDGVSDPLLRRRDQLLSWRAQSRSSSISAVGSETWLALLAVILILFLGAAFEDLLFAFQLGYFVSALAGLLALLALDRRDSPGDLYCMCACSSSRLHLASSASLLIGATGQPRHGEGAPREHIYRRASADRALWALVAWMGSRGVYKSVGEQRLSGAPEHAIDCASAGISRIARSRVRRWQSRAYLPDLILGHVIFLVGLMLLFVKIRRERSISVGLASALAIGVSYWFLLGSNRDADRPTERYQYASAIFLLLIAAEMLAGTPHSKAGGRRWSPCSLGSQRSPGCPLLQEI